MVDNFVASTTHKKKTQTKQDKLKNTFRILPERVTLYLCI